MAYKIPQETLQRSTQCSFAFACQESSAWQTCTVERDVSGSVLYINPREGLVCPYHVRFGYGHMCACPTRVEIYLRHGV